MQFIRPGVNIDFMGYKKLFISLSGALVLISLLLLAWKGGPNYGVDFTGGVVVQIKLVCYKIQAYHCYRDDAILI